MKSSYKLRYQFYGIRAGTKEEAIRLAIGRIRADPEGFVLNAEMEADERTLVGRLIWGA